MGIYCRIYYQLQRAIYASAMVVGSCSSRVLILHNQSRSVFTPPLHLHRVHVLNICGNYRSYSNDRVSTISPKVRPLRLRISTVGNQSFKNADFAEYADKIVMKTDSFRIESTLNHFAKLNVLAFCRRENNSVVNATAKELYETIVRKCCIVIEGCADLPQSNIHLSPPEAAIEAFHAVTVLRAESKNTFICGIAVAGSPENAISLSYMHAVNVIDTHGFNLFSMPSRQKCHIESQREKGLLPPSPVGVQHTISRPLPLIDEILISQRKSACRQPIQFATIPKFPLTASGRKDSLDLKKYMIPPEIKSLIDAGNFTRLHRARDNEIISSEHCTSSKVLDFTARSRIARFLKMNKVNYDSSVVIMPFNQAGQTFHVSYIEIPGIARVENQHKGIGIAPRSKEAEILMCQHVEHLIDLHGLQLYRDAERYREHRKYASIFGRETKGRPSKIVLKSIPPFCLDINAENCGPFLFENMCVHLRTNTHNSIQTIEPSAREKVRRAFHNIRERLVQYSFMYQIAEGARSVNDGIYKTGYRHIILLPKSSLYPQCCAVGSSRSKFDAEELAYMHAAAILFSKNPVQDLNQLPAPYRRLSTREENDANLMKTSLVHHLRTNQKAQLPLRIPQTPSGDDCTFSLHCVSVAKALRRTPDGFVHVRFAPILHNQPDHTLYSPSIFCRKSKARISQWVVSNQVLIAHSESVAAMKVIFDDSTYKIWTLREHSLSVDILFEGQTKRLKATGHGMTKLDASYLAFMHLELLLDYYGITLFNDRRTQEEHARCCRKLGRWATGDKSIPLPQREPPAPLRRVPLSLISGIVVRLVDIEEVVSAPVDPNVMILSKDVHVNAFLGVFKNSDETRHRSIMMIGQQTNYMKLLREFLQSLRHYFDMRHPRFQKMSLYKTNTTMTRGPGFQVSGWVPLPNGEVQLFQSVASSYAASLSLLLNVGRLLRSVGYSFFSDPKKEQLCDETVLSLLPRADATQKQLGILCIVEELQAKVIIASLKISKNRLKRFVSDRIKPVNSVFLAPWAYKSMDLDEGDSGENLSGKFNRNRILCLKPSQLSELPYVQTPSSPHISKKILMGPKRMETIYTPESWKTFVDHSRLYIDFRKRKADIERLRVFQCPFTGDPLIDTAIRACDAKPLDFHAKTNLNNFCYRKGLALPLATSQKINGCHILYFSVPGYPYLRAFGCGPSIADAFRRAAMHSLEVLALVDAEFQPFRRFSFEAKVMSSAWIRNILELYSICMGLPEARVQIATQEDRIKCTISISLDDVGGESLTVERLHGGIRHAKEEATTSLFVLLCKKSPALNALVEITKGYTQLRTEHIPVLQLSENDFNNSRRLANDIMKLSAVTEDEQLYEAQCMNNALFNQSVEDAHAQNQVKSAVIVSNFATNMPIFESKDTILKNIKNHPIILLCGSTGCGKTTQVPQYILAEQSTAKIIVTQPRRISAISIANRVASDYREAVGGKVGFCVRFDSRLGSNINYMTTGTLLQLLRSDPELLSVTHLLIDEVHERDANTDFLLLVVRNLIFSRPDLRIVIMTATLDTAKFSAYFKGHVLKENINPLESALTPNLQAEIPVIHVKSGMHPVNIHYLDTIAEIAKAKSFSSQQLQLFDAANTTLQPNTLDYKLMVFIIMYAVKADNAFGGSILIFLPGLHEIHSAWESIPHSPIFKSFILHSQIPLEEQMECFQPIDANHVKLIFATNIAESSVTIPDVRIVIDFGQSREKVYRSIFSEHKNVERQFELSTVIASQANCIQRTGRAGRTQSGVCYRLFTREDFNNMSTYRESEINSIPLDRMSIDILSLDCKLREASLQKTFEAFISPPSLQSVAEAVGRLKRMGALDGNEHLTEVGGVLNLFPLPPNMTRAVLWSCLVGCLDSILTLSSIAEIGSIFNHAKREELAFQKDVFANETMSEQIGVLNLYKEWEHMHTSNSIDHSKITSFVSCSNLDSKKIHLVSRIKRQIHRILRETGFIEANNHGVDTRGVFMDTSIASRYASRSALVKGLLCCMYAPNFAMKYGCFGYNDSKDYRTKAHQSVQVRSNILMARKAKSSPFLLYANRFSGKERSQNIEDISMVSIWGILLFGIERNMLYFRDDLRLCIIDDWIMVSMDEELFDLIVTIKSMLEMTISRKGILQSEEQSAELIQSIGDIIQRIVSTPVKHGISGETYREEGEITSLMGQNNRKCT